MAKKEYDLEEELELIRRAQTGDKIALKQLRVRFDGAINKAVKESRVTSHNITEEGLKARAIQAFKKSILNYDGSRDVKPSSYIIGYIAKDLKNEAALYKNDTRIQSANMWDIEAIESAKNKLRGDGIDEPTVFDIQNTLKANYNKDLSEDHINKVLGQQRRELSVNTEIGEDGVGENITLGEVADVGDVTGQDALKQMNFEEQTLSLINQLDEKERDMYMKFKGFGPYKENGQMKINDWAKENSLGSGYYGEKKVKEIENKLKDFAKPKIGGDF
jgi:DNA-directed RNA polymerase sigma subunit (sigma70/sigma32)